jgi:Lon protease-like protein
VKLPSEAPVMTLPNATLFPHALLPLYIFEPRYREMLSHALEEDRVVAVAMKKPGSARETPMPIAGLGLVRVCVTHKDGTSHVVLQGMTRVSLEGAVRYKPYRRYRIRPLRTPPCDTVAADALIAKVRELMLERLDLGLPFPPMPAIQTGESPDPPSAVSAKEVVGFINSIGNPEQVADLVSCAVLPEAVERQAILEAVDVETRLRRLIRFLMREIREHQKDDHK